MARDFDGVNDLLRVGAAVVTTTPFTMACWFYPRNITGNHGLMGIETVGSNNNLHLLSAAGAVAGDPIRAWSRTSSSVSASTTTGFSANVWQHACGVWASATDRRVFLNGGSKGTNATNINPSGMNRTQIGMDQSGTEEMSGLIAEACIWNVALTDAEVLLLANGVHPWRIRASAIAAGGYWPLYGTQTAEADFSGRGNHLTVTEAIRGDHPPKIEIWSLPRRVQRIFAVPETITQDKWGQPLQQPYPDKFSVVAY